MACRKIVCALGLVDELELRLAADRLVVFAVVVRPLDRDDGRLGDGRAAGFRPAEGVERHGRVVARPRPDVVGAALLEAPEQARHSGHARADDAHVELDQRPRGELGKVHGRVGARRPSDQGPETDHAADGDKETDEERKNDTGLLLHVQIELETKSQLVSICFPLEFRLL